MEIKDKKKYILIMSSNGLDPIERIMIDENAEELFDESTNELIECLSAGEHFEEDEKFFYYQNMENINGKRTRDESRKREKYRRFDLEKCTWYQWYKLPLNDSVYDETSTKAYINL